MIISNLLMFPFTLMGNPLNGIVTGIMGGFTLGFTNVFPDFMIGAAFEVPALKPLGAGVVGTIVTPQVATVFLAGVIDTCRIIWHSTHWTRHRYTLISHGIFASSSDVVHERPYNGDCRLDYISNCGYLQP